MCRAVSCPPIHKLYLNRRADIIENGGSNSRIQQAMRSAKANKWDIKAKGTLKKIQLLVVRKDSMRVFIVRDQAEGKKDHTAGETAQFSAAASDISKEVHLVSQRLQQLTQCT